MQLKELIQTFTTIDKQVQVLASTAELASTPPQINLCLNEISGNLSIILKLLNNLANNIHMMDRYQETELKTYIEKINDISRSNKLTKESLELNHKFANQIKAEIDDFSELLDFDLNTAEIQAREVEINQLLNDFRLQVNLLGSQNELYENLTFNSEEALALQNKLLEIRKQFRKKYDILEQQLKLTQEQVAGIMQIVNSKQNQLEQDSTPDKELEDGLRDLITQIATAIHNYQTKDKQNIIQNYKKYLKDNIGVFAKLHYKLNKLANGVENTLLPNVTTTTVFQQAYNKLQDKLNTKALQIPRMGRANDASSYTTAEDYDDYENDIVSRIHAEEAILPRVVKNISHSKLKTALIIAGATITIPLACIGFGAVIAGSIELAKLSLIASIMLPIIIGGAAIILGVAATVYLAYKVSKNILQSVGNRLNDSVWECKTKPKKKSKLVTKETKTNSSPSHEYTVPVINKKLAKRKTEANKDPWLLAQRDIQTTLMGLQTPKLGKSIFQSKSKSKSTPSCHARPQLRG